MNVTIKMDDQLCREARHRAVDRGLSLSAWIAEVLRGEIGRDAGKEPAGLFASLAMEEFADREFEVSRDSSAARSVIFS